MCYNRHKYSNNMINTLKIVFLLRCIVDDDILDQMKGESRR